MWGGGAEDTNDRGREPEKIFFELELMVLNQGNEYTFDTGNRNSITDVRVANKFALKSGIWMTGRLKIMRHSQTTNISLSLDALFTQ